MAERYAAQQDTLSAVLLLESAVREWQSLLPATQPDLVAAKAKAEELVSRLEPLDMRVVSAGRSCQECLGMGRGGRKVGGPGQGRGAVSWLKLSLVVKGREGGEMGLCQGQGKTVRRSFSGLEQQVARV